MEETILPTDIYLSVPVRLSNRSNQDLRKKINPFDNQIFLSKEPVGPVILIQGLRFYYSPSDICNYVLSFSDLCYIANLFISSLSPTFVLLLKTHSIKSAQTLMEKLKKNTNPICSMDILDFQYVHSVDFKSYSLSHRYSEFMDHKYLFDGQCPICLIKFSIDQLLFILPCSHTLHAKCMTKIPQWKCPLCRDTPISSLEITCCDICQSYDNLFICLCCSRTFCRTHCHDHYVQEGHAYLASADGRETWNMMSGTSMKRIAMDKSGEFVEMCAKEDYLSNYLDSALANQIMIHQSLGDEKKANECQTIEDKKKRLNILILEKKNKIKMMKASIDQKDIKEKKLKCSLNILQTLNSRLEILPEENRQLEQENGQLEKQVQDMNEMITDMEATCKISLAACLTGDNEKIQVNFNSGNSPPPPPPPHPSGSPSNSHSKRKKKP